MSHKGGGTLQDQINKLEQDLEQKDIEQAKTMAKSSPTMVRLAFKYLAKPAQDGLSKSQLKTFEQIKAISPANAEAWKAARIAEKK